MMFDQKPAAIGGENAPNVELITDGGNVERRNLTDSECNSSRISLGCGVPFTVARIKKCACPRAKISVAPFRHFASFARKGSGEIGSSELITVD
jgi:hypothetical protein